MQHPEPVAWDVAMDRRSKHLSSEERGMIFAEHNRGGSQRSIGQLLQRPASKICRELARGRQEDGTYCPHAMPTPAKAGRGRHGLSIRSHLVYRRWSPEQIAHRLRLMNERPRKTLGWNPPAEAIA